MSPLASNTPMRSYILCRVVLGRLHHLKLCIFVGLWEMAQKRTLDAFFTAVPKRRRENEPDQDVSLPQCTRHEPSRIVSK